MPWTWEERHQVTDLQGDPAAVGAAVTVALCGHWEHDGPCRWPHHTSTVPGLGSSALVVVGFDAPEHDVDVVCGRITEALGTGRQRGPDGATTTWRRSS